jgi:hypothetical protein
MTMREYLIKASNMSATYTAGRYCANSPQEACAMAREDYRNSAMGRQFKDTAAFRFWVSSDDRDMDG